MLNQVYQEEKSEIEKARQLSLKNQSIVETTNAAAAADNEDDDLESEASSSSSSSSVEKDLDNTYRVGAVPDRLKKKTRQIRRKQVSSTTLFYLLFEIYRKSIKRDLSSNIWPNKIN